MRNTVSGRTFRVKGGVQTLMKNSGKSGITVTRLSERQFTRLQESIRKQGNELTKGISREAGRDARVGRQQGRSMTYGRPEGNR